ncbi:MAG TPA: hypothetical protein VF215_05960 [Thermoanaerobaculia bacterium]
MLDGAVAMVGDECVATMFALRRTYLTPAGPREFIEPFEWHSNEEWRAQAPGFRLARFFMRGPRALIGLPGTESATGLLERLRWARRGFLERYALPLSGRFIRSRGRNALMGLAFDLVGRPLYKPAARKGGRVRLVASDAYPDQALEMVAAQRQFGLMRQPDATTLAWLRRAPGALGRYTVHHVYDGSALAGWILTREYQRGGMRIGEILELFLRDEARHLYGDAVAAASAQLAGRGVDGLLATSSSPEAIAGLHAARYRLDERREVFIWWKGDDAPEGAVLADGAIADHAFFPVDASASQA